MAQPLTALEAYRAGLADVTQARAEATDLCIQHNAAKSYHNFFCEALLELRQKRIDSGQLPPVETAPTTKKPARSAL